MTWFHCARNCDKWSKAPTGFNELKHNVKCSCGSLMYLNRGEGPESIYCGDHHKYETTGTLVACPTP